jgi:hypothetical protein
MPVYMFIDPEGDVHELGRTHPLTSDEGPCVTLCVTTVAAEAELWFDQLAAGQAPEIEYTGSYPLLPE